MDEFFIQNEKYVSAKRAGKTLGYSNDYISKLCRDGVIDSQRVGRAWYVRESAIPGFREEHESLKLKKHEDLSRKRIEEYRASVSEFEKETTKTARKTIETFQKAPRKSFFVPALGTAMFVLVGILGFSDFGSAQVFDFRKVEIPDMPEINMPEISMPKVSLPKVALPKINMAGTFAAVSDESQKISETYLNSINDGLNFYKKVITGTGEFVEEKTVAAINVPISILKYSASEINSGFEKVSFGLSDTTKKVQTSITQIPENLDQEKNKILNKINQTKNTLQANVFSSFIDSASVLAESVYCTFSGIFGGSCVTPSDDTPQETEFTVKTVDEKSDGPSSTNPIIVYQTTQTNYSGLTSDELEARLRIFEYQLDLAKGDTKVVYRDGLSKQSDSLIDSMNDGVDEAVSGGDTEFSGASLTTTGNITSGGVISALSFVGDGSGLTGISSGGVSTSTVLELFSNTATGLLYDNTTGVTSLVSGYTIPLTASTTEWANNVSSQWTTNGSDIYYNGGNIGIGTTTPEDKLEVIGNITAYGALASIGKVGASAQLYLVDDVNGYGGIDIHSFGGGMTDSPHSYINLISSRGNQNAVSNIEQGDDLGTLNFYAQTDSGLELASSIGAVANSNFSGDSVPSDLYFITNKTEKLRITSDGNVGIGTTTPAASLHIVNAIGGQTAGVLMTDTSLIGSGSKFGRYGSEHFNSDEEPFYYMLSRQTSSENRLQLGGGTSNGNAATSIEFYTAANNTTTEGTERMRILSNGNIGIGENVPTSKLHIKSDDNTQATNILSVYSNNGAQGFGIGFNVLRQLGTNANIGIDASGTGWTYLNGGGATGGVQIGKATNPNAALRIDNTFGVTKPVLDVFGQASQSADLIRVGNSAGTLFFRIASNGNVGISNNGSGTPSQMFEVKNTTTHAGIAFDAATDADAFFHFKEAGTVRADFFYDSSENVFKLRATEAGSKIAFSTAGATERMVIDENGKVRIGTTGSTDKISIYDTSNVSLGLYAAGGSGNTASFNFGPWLTRPGGAPTRIVSTDDGSAGAHLSFYSINDSASAAAERMRITSAGNIGIGTTTPAAKFSVSDSSGGYANFGLTSGTEYYQIVGPPSPVSGNTLFSVKTDGSIGAVGKVFSATIASGNGLIVGGTGYVNVTGANQILYVGSGNGTINFGGTTGTETILTGKSAGLTTTDLVIKSQNTRTAGNLFAVDNNADRKFVIDYAGNVGVGTTTPGSTLTVAGNTYISSGLGLGITNTNPYTIAFGVSSAGNRILLVPNGTYGMGINSNDFASWSNNYFTWRGGAINGAIYMTVGSTGLGVGTTAGSASAKIHSVATTEQLRLGYDSSNYFSTTVGSSGLVTLDAVGAGSAFSFSDNVGIGTTTPSTKLDIWGNLNVATGTNPALFANTTTGFVGFGTSDPKDSVHIARGGLLVSSATGGNGGSGAHFDFFASKVRFFGYNYGAGSYFDASVNDSMLVKGGTGKVGIGNVNTVNPQSFLTVQGNLTVGANYNGIAASTNGAIIEGNVGIGTTSPQQKLHVVRTDDGAPVRFEDANGYCEMDPTSTTWTCTSDVRLKENINSISSSSTLDLIIQLNPVTFSWKTDSTHAERIGLIAQEVEKIFPDLVTEDSKTGFKSVAYGGFTAYFISAIQELAHKVGNMAKWFSSDGDKFQIEGEICVDDVCLTKEQFKNLIKTTSGIPNEENNNSDDEQNEDQNETEDENNASSTDEIVEESVELPTENPGLTDSDTVEYTDNTDDSSETEEETPAVEDVPAEVEEPELEPEPEPESESIAEPEA